MINLEKITYEKCQRLPPPLLQTHTHTHTLLREPAPAPYFHPLFLIFQIPPSRRGNQQNFLLPTLNKWRGEGGDLSYVIHNLYKKNQPQT